MQDTWLIAVALTVSAAGIIGLLFALIVLQPKEASPENLLDGASVQVTGILEGISTRGNLTILTISRNTTIDAVVFEILNLSIEPGTCVSLRGKKGTYNDHTQIIVSKITQC